MKNNIILILVVTVISIAIIAISVAISAGGSDNDTSDSQQITVSTTASAATTTTTTPPVTEPVTTFSSTTNVTTAPPVHDSETAEHIVATAQSLIGIDFADDGDSPDEGFDNSGFIYYVLRENGYITCPRGVWGQAEMGNIVTYDELKRGDLVFFYSEDYSAVGFGGIYIGDGKMIACLMPGTQVKEVNIDTEYYRTYFAHGVSIT